MMVGWSGLSGVEINGEGGSKTLSDFEGLVMHRGMLDIRTKTNQITAVEHFDVISPSHLLLWMNQPTEPTDCEMRMNK